MAREYLAALRRERNESQQDVANAVGISRQYYCMIEAGDRQKRMDIMLLSGLAAHFGVPVSELVALEQQTQALPDGRDELTQHPDSTTPNIP